jgi:hypothetical protein
MVAWAAPCADRSKWRVGLRPRASYSRAFATARRLATLAGAIALVASSVASNAWALNPDSPEVQALVRKAMDYLGKSSDDRLGAKCLAGLAFHKFGAPDSHPKIQEAIAACRDQLEQERMVTYLYSKALAIIFLAELDAARHQELIRSYTELLDRHQWDHGGFGYLNEQAGDTSQSQYAALAYWELLNHGMPPNAEAAQRCLKWLLRTQDPSGSWSYHAVDPGVGNYTLIKQADRVGLSMGAAGTGAALILGNTLGLLTSNQPEPVSENHPLGELPAALSRVDDPSATTRRARPLPPGDVPPERLAACLTLAEAYWKQNDNIQTDVFQYYYMYSIERMRSFEAFITGNEDPEPAWYNAGVAYLTKTQAQDGSWSDQCGAVSDTAFGVLFLLRSTQQSIKATLGEGTLVGGRGLPRDLSKVRLQGGKLVVQQNVTELDQLLDMMESGDSDELDSLIGSPAALEVTAVTPEAARRLQQIVRSGTPESRLLAVRALAKARELDYAPTLIYALTDPDHAVVREARDGLQSVSRSFEGYGPPDNFDAGQQQQAVARWKEWYATVRPDAPPLP